MDREQIERQDFPAARRGYDAAAVREHLRRVADEFDALARRPASGSLADGAAARVQGIIEAAETSARQLRDDAGREASEHVERVGKAARELLAKLDALQGELDRLLGGLTSTAEGLAASLDEAARDVAVLGRAQPAGPAEPAAPASSAEPAARASSAEPASPAGPVPSPEPASSAPAPSVNGARSDDEAGARLVALNMALEGASREEAGRYLAEHYELRDPDGLLDDVYTSAGR